MVKSNIRHITACLLFLVSLCAQSETRICQVMSIDTLNNNVFLIYLMDANCKIYKSIADSDSLKESAEVPVNIRVGITAPFSLRSLYKEQKQWVKSHKYLNIDRFYKGVNVKGNNISPDTINGVQPDIFMIMNANGLSLYSDKSLNSGIGGHKVQKPYLDDKAFRSTVALIEEHIRDTLQIKDYIIYWPFDDTADEMFSNNVTVISREYIASYNFDGSMNPTIRSCTILPELTDDVEDLFTKSILLSDLQTSDVSDIMINRCVEYIAYYHNSELQFSFFVPLLWKSCESRTQELVKKIDALILYICVFSE